MTDIKFTLDGKEVSASADETIWQVAKREGTRIPHLCYLDKPGYRSDGNCRACMVEIEGERVLAASCQRKASDGLVVKTDTERADKSRKMVFELLAADMREPDEGPDGKADFWEWAGDFGIGGSDRLPSKFDGSTDPANGNTPGVHDITNPAIAVNLDACIACNLCVRACREVQVNDVLGMGERGHHSVPVFDIRDPRVHCLKKHLWTMREKPVWWKTSTRPRIPFAHSVALVARQPFTPKTKRLFWWMDAMALLITIASVLKVALVTIMQCRVNA